MNTTATTQPRAIVETLIRQARDASRNVRIYKSSADYWRGMKKGFLSAARELAHVTLGLSWCSARERRRLNFSTTTLSV